MPRAERDLAGIYYRIQAMSSETARNWYPKQVEVLHVRHGARGEFSPKEFVSDTPPTPARNSGG